MSKEMREQIDRIKNFKQSLNESLLNRNAIPAIVYHGGDCDNLRSLYKNFVILTPEEKIQYPSSGGGNFGLSTTIEKSIAKKYSSVFGCKYVLSLKVNQNAKFMFINTEGEGIDQLYSYDDLEKLANNGYDAIMETDDGAEKEVRILKPDNFKVIQIGI